MLKNHHICSPCIASPIYSVSQNLTVMTKKSDNSYPLLPPNCGLKTTDPVHVRQDCLHPRQALKKGTILRDKDLILQVS